MTEGLLYSVQAHNQARLLSPRGIGVNHALLHGLIESGNRLAENLVGARFVAFRQRLAELPQCGAKAGSVGPVAGGSFLSLSGALQRRKMICHSWSLPSL